jgi:hypothetical protein
MRLTSSLEPLAMNMSAPGRETGRRHVFLKVLWCYGATLLELEPTMISPPLSRYA